MDEAGTKPEYDYEKAMYANISMLRMYAGVAVVLLLAIVGLLAFIAFNGIPVEVG